MYVCVSVRQRESVKRTQKGGKNLQNALDLKFFDVLLFHVELSPPGVGPCDLQMNMSWLIYTIICCNQQTI